MQFFENFHKAIVVDNAVKTQAGIALYPNLAAIAIAKGY